MERLDENHVLRNKHTGGLLTSYVNLEIRCFGIPNDYIIPHSGGVDIEVEFNIFAEMADKEEARRIGENSRREGPGSMTVKVLES